MTVRVESVSKSYGRVRALLSVSCTMEAGEVTVVRGGNGSGKTTLLKIVGTLERPSTGKVHYPSGFSHRLDIRRSLGWLGHDSLLYPDLSGEENLSFAASLRGLSAHETEAMVDRFRLRPFFGRPVRTYSRGQRQRVSLACGLLGQPNVVLLDEPTTGLDREGQQTIAETIETERGRGAVVVVVTHDQDLIAQVKGAILTMDRGRLVSVDRVG